MSAAEKGKPLARNNTSFPVQASARLRALHAEYVRLRAAAAGGAGGEDAAVAAGLKYYQFLVRAVMTDPEFGIGAAGNARGLLVYHTMGMGKTFLAVAAAMAMWDVRPPLVLVAKSLQANFRRTIEKFVALTAARGLGGAALAEAQAAAVARFRFVSLDAYNMATQVARATAGVGGAGGLGGRLLIVDEAHNLFRGIINSPADTTNARRFYEMVMGARDLRILFLTGTPASKDPFELVPCFNMLAGYDLLPPQYEAFYKHYVDKAAGAVRNRAKLANRLVGLVSHVTHTLPSAPAGDSDGDSDSDGDGGAPRPRETGGFPEEVAPVVERVEMAAGQYRQYLDAREREEAEGGSGGKGAAKTAVSDLRAAATPALSLPGSAAGAGSTYYVKSRALGNFAPPGGGPVAALPDAAFSAETAPKVARLVENLAESAGPVLIYSQFVGVGGLAVVARFLRNAGFVAFRLPLARQGILAHVRDKAAEPSAAGDDAASPSAAAPVFRYAVISGEVKPDDRARIQEVFNAPGNAHGELIRALLVSKTGAEGLDLKGVRQIHILEPYWDKAREDQVRARGVRLGSHDHLPAAEREVRSFLYIATANQEILEGMRPPPDGDENGDGDGDGENDRRAPAALIEEVTIDEKFHARALEKHALNGAFRALLRDVSLECAANGYGGCRICIPTDAPLFLEDPIRDLELPDPCRPLAEAEVAVREIRLPSAEGDGGDGGQTYFYHEDPAAAFGVNFFVYDAEVEAHVPIDPSTGLFLRLLGALRDGQVDR